MKPRDFGGRFTSFGWLVVIFSMLHVALTTTVFFEPKILLIYGSYWPAALAFMFMLPIMLVYLWHRFGRGRYFYRETFRGTKKKRTFAFDAIGGAIGYPFLSGTYVFAPEIAAYRGSLLPVVMGIIIIGPFGLIYLWYHFGREK